MSDGQHCELRPGDSVAQLFGLGQRPQPIVPPCDDERWTGDHSQAIAIPVAPKADLTLVGFASQPKAHPPDPFDQQLLVLALVREGLAD